jgi:Tfp pilus assembly protein PilN
MAGLSLVQTVGTSRQRGRLADQERANQALQAQIDKLSGALETEQDLALARQGVTAALAGDVSWPRVLEDLAGTLPEGVWLTSFNLQPAPGGTAGSIGTASFAATAFDFPGVAAWLDRLPRIPYYLDLFVSSATKSEGGPRPLVTFTSSAGVGPAAQSDRLQRILEPGR